MAEQDPLKGYRPEILPRQVEAVIEGATRVGKYLGAIVFNTNVQMPTIFPPETDLKTSEHIHREFQPEFDFPEKRPDAGL